MLMNIVTFTQKYAAFSSTILLRSRDEARKTLRGFVFVEFVFGDLYLGFVFRGFVFGGLYFEGLNLGIPLNLNIILRLFWLF